MLAALRPAARRQIRFYASASKSAEYEAQQEAIRHHAIEATNLWRRISLYVALPSIIACGVYVGQNELHHIEHTQHLIHENDGTVPQPPAMEYLNRRSKPFPWGNNSLFFSKGINKDMDAASEE